MDSFPVPTEAAPSVNPVVTLPHAEFVPPYKQPVKMIKTHEDLATFQKSHALKSYMDFLEKCTTAVTGKKISDTYPASPVRSVFLLPLLPAQFHLHMCD